MKSIVVMIVGLMCVLFLFRLTLPFFLRNLRGFESGVQDSEEVPVEN